MATENLDDCTGGLSSEYLESPEINQCSCPGSRQRNGILDCAETPGESHGWPYAFKTLARSIWSLTVCLPPPRRAREDAPGCDECIQRRKWKQEQSCFREGLRVWGPDCSLRLLFLVHYCLHEWMSVNDSKYFGQFMMSSPISHWALTVLLCSVATLQQPYENIGLIINWELELRGTRGNVWMQKRCLLGLDPQMHHWWMLWLFLSERESSWTSESGQHHWLDRFLWPVWQTVSVPEYEIKKGESAPLKPLVLISIFHIMNKIGFPCFPILLTSLSLNLTSQDDWSASTELAWGSFVLHHQTWLAEQPPSLTDMLY